jgi:ectoine hydroxylase-related dioxygenase (phytanoyl-CoA dioxygenase family)
MWDARTEPGIIDAFARLWGTDELLVSFDTINISFPNRKDSPWKGSPPHVDQSPFRQGLHCVQGIINLSKAGPEDGGLVVYPGSHKYLEEFFETQTDKSTWDRRDAYGFQESQVEWFKNKGIAPVKVCAEVGDLIMWDSRTVHHPIQPSKLSNTIRTVIYASYTPARFAHPESLKVKAEIFEKFGGTTHWAHDNIVPRYEKARREDGTVDPKDTSEPFEKPERSDKLLKLAGVKAY